MRCWIWIAVVSAWSCSSKDDQATPRDRVVASTPRNTTATSSAPGKAYFVVNPRGVVALDDGKLEAFAVPDKHPQYIYTVVAAPNGDLLVQSVSDIYRAAGGKVAPVAKMPMWLTSDKLVPAPDGTLWSWTISNAGHFDGTSWTQIKGSSLGSSGIEGLAIAKDGTVWLAEQDQLFKWAGRAFEPVTLAPIGKPSFEELVATDDGKVYASTSAGIVDVTAPSATPIKLAGLDPRLTHLAAGPGGRVAALDSSGHLAVLVPPDRVIAYKALPTPGHDAFTVDGAGRIWISTKTGLVVYDAAGTPTSFPIGTVPMLIGRISSITVLGDGPTLPVVGEVERGRVRGRVTSAGGTAIAGATVEICAAPKQMFSRDESPCAGEPFAMSTRTNQVGDFVFDGVPVGMWSFAVLPTPDGKWIPSPSLYFYGYCASMKKGETCDAPLQLDR